jgi:hypothetical protein
MARHPEGGFATEGSTLNQGRFFAALRFAQNDSLVSAARTVLLPDERSNALAAGRPNGSGFGR